MFFRLNESLYLFERHCLFKLNVDFLQAVKVAKSSHHLFHDRASKGHGSIPCLMSKTDLHHNLCKHACKEVCDVKPGIDSYSSLAQLWTTWWPDFVTFTACK